MSPFAIVEEAVGALQKGHAFARVDVARRYGGEQPLCRPTAAALSRRSGIRRPRTDLPHGGERRVLTRPAYQPPSTP